MLHKMKLSESPFERMKNGVKTIEFRLFDEKRQKIKVGDKIEFSKLPDLQEKLLVDVTQLYREDTFEILFRKLYTDEEEINRKTNSMHQYYSPEEEKEYGVIGIKISLVKNIYTYNKLVRDKIPEIINSDNRKPITRTLNNEEYLEALNKKLQEEVNEYLADNNVEELADIVEVVYGILNANNISINQFEDIRKGKVEKRGAFQEKIFLEKVFEEGEYLKKINSLA